MATWLGANFVKSVNNNMLICNFVVNLLTQKFNLFPRMELKLIWLMFAKASLLLSFTPLLGEVRASRSRKGSKFNICISLWCLCIIIYLD